MSKKSSHFVAVSTAFLLLAGPTLAVDLATIKKECDAQNPNEPFHTCMAENSLGANVKAREAACNARPEVQVINKRYDACVQERIGSLQERIGSPFKS